MKAREPRHRTVGVLGGMGPQATVDFLDKVLRASRATTDQDHVRMLVDINPQVPDRNEAVAAGSREPGRVLGGMASGLERAGADFLVMPCNTAHAFQSEIVRCTRLPFVSLIAESVGALRASCPGVRVAGVLATSSCLQVGLYQAALKATGIEPLVASAEEQRSFMDLVYRIKAGDRGSAVRAAMRERIEHLFALGADAVLSACTEVPLVSDVASYSRPLIESTTVLAQRTVAYARGEIKLPSA